MKKFLLTLAFRITEPGTPRGTTSFSLGKDTKQLGEKPNERNQVCGGTGTGPCDRQDFLHPSLRGFFPVELNLVCILLQRGLNSETSAAFLLKERSDTKKANE